MKIEKKKTLAIIGGAILGVGVIGMGAKMILDSNQTGTTVETGVEVKVSSNKTETITLTDGENKITAGGTYTITGATENGYVYTETEDEVKIILENEGKRFVFDCARTLRPDVEMVFPTQRDCRLSGFVAKISADIIPKGENKIYIALVKPALLSKSRFKGAIRDSGRVLELK